MRESTVYDSLIEINQKKGYVAAILKRLKITEVMSKPNDSRQRSNILEQGNIFFLLSRQLDQE